MNQIEKAARAISLLLRCICLAKGEPPNGVFPYVNSSHLASGQVLTSEPEQMDLGTWKNRGNPEAKRSKKGLGQLPNPLIFLERETGFEPATFSLGS